MFAEAFAFAYVYEFIDIAENFLAFWLHGYQIQDLCNFYSVAFGLSIAWRKDVDFRVKLNKNIE